MKTQNTKLTFRKDSLVELNETQLISIDGGSSPACVTVVVAFIGSLNFSFNLGKEKK